ncbi:DUF1501 domain-containing protein [Mycolicibacterium moriokaense]|uniref:Uncharacterized protein (DUF1501 family) n=1 Tax=Mycolicibacterium moriokaense TaxID=39691 RepID=A0A318HK04_9MYCO|nr:DUF1501 domain-containing protein [Mycolicibacterium moriokaense]PXX10993.1 uncharacterized protein (DUF1501 family) [Mycolicibacterium moriokaense]
MAEFNRRKFLIASAGVGAAGVMSGAVAITLPDLLRSAHDRPLTAGSGILVIVTLYGGNDGINTLIPYSDNAYYDARPEIAIKPSDVLPLDAQLGLNPALKGMAAQWHNQKLAIVRGVGYPNQDRSHFRSMDIWQTASPSAPVPTGWIGRWLDATGDHPLRAVGVGPVLPLAAIGEKQVAAALLPGIPQVSREVASTLAVLGADDPHDTRAMSAVRASCRANGTTRAAFETVVSTQDLAPPSTGQGDKSLTPDLNVVAACVKAGVPTRVYLVEDRGDFDTHADEPGGHQTLLQNLDVSLTGFLNEMMLDDRGKHVVVVVYSEFGRRVAANASEGTDHGTAGPVFIAGAPVKGGFYGDQPSLTDLVDGDLKTTTDFRDIYHELLSKTVGTDPGPSVGTGRRDLGFL